MDNVGVIKGDGDQTSKTISDDVGVIKGDGDQTSKPISDNVGVIKVVGSQMEGVVQCDSKCLSGTADNDPEEDIMLTPTKRSSSELSAKEVSSEEVPAPLLSATKPSKTIKTE